MKTIQQHWQFYWQLPIFKRTFLLLIAATVATLLCLTPFFAAIEARQGYQLNDWLVNKLPPTDFSIPIFICIWGTGLLTTIRSIQQPLIAVQFIGGFLLLTLTRMVTISLVPLNPPTNLIPVIDPLSNYFYPEGFITKDLFFSGHTSTQLLTFFTLQKKIDKRITCFTSIAVGIMVLMQHIHYTIDVLAALPFSYLVYSMSKKWWVNPLPKNII